MRGNRPTPHLPAPAASGDPRRFHMPAPPHTRLGAPLPPLPLLEPVTLFSGHLYHARPAHVSVRPETPHPLLHPRSTPPPARESPTPTRSVPTRRKRFPETSACMLPRKAALAVEHRTIPVLTRPPSLAVSRDACAPIPQPSSLPPPSPPTPSSNPRRTHRCACYFSHTPAYTRPPVGER